MIGHKDSCGYLKEQQRRQNPSPMKLRIVSGCVPILLAPFYNNPLERIRDCPKGDVQCLNRIDLRGSKFLFTNSRKNPGYYVFPKGGVKRKEDPKEAAIRETFEETGVEGEVFDEYQGKGWYWYLMNIKKIHDDWMEKDQRERVWVPYEEIKYFEPTLKHTKKLIKKIRKHYKHLDSDSESSSSSDSD